MRKLLHLARAQPEPRLFPPAFRRALAEWGELEIVLDAGRWSEAETAERIRGCQILLTGWGSVAVPATVADDRGLLEYICHLTGEMSRIIPLDVICSGIPVTNWGDAPAFSVAEAALALLLACLKNLRPHIETKRNGEWRLGAMRTTGSLSGLRLGIYGFGVIGRSFYELCRPFEPRVLVYDPYVQDCEAERVGTLDELFERSDAVAIHAGLTEETRRSVTAAHLAKLPDDGILVNTARGGIVDQEALFAELASGRLRAALDVLDGDDRLPPDHPARGWPNLILTSHQASHSDWPPDADRLAPLHHVCLENLRRFRAGEPLRFVMDETRYRRST